MFICSNLLIILYTIYRYYITVNFNLPVHVLESLLVSLLVCWYSLRTVARNDPESTASTNARMQVDLTVDYSYSYSSTYFYSIKVLEYSRAVPVYTLIYHTGIIQVL